MHEQLLPEQPFPEHIEVKIPVVTTSDIIDGATKIRCEAEVKWIESCGEKGFNYFRKRFSFSNLAKFEKETDAKEIVHQEEVPLVPDHRNI